MLYRKSLLALFLLSSLLLSSCKAQGTETPITGIDQSLVTQEAVIRVHNARILRNFQTSYQMEYPGDGFVFYEVNLSISGISEDPAQTLSWGYDQLRLVNQEGKYQAVRARMVDDQRKTVYGVGEDVEYSYTYFFEVPDAREYTTYRLQVAKNREIPLGSLVITLRPTSTPGGSELHTSVGGGENNTASAVYSTISGGHANNASAAYTSVGGGWRNHASYYFATIGGGFANSAEGRDSFIGGGSRNTCSGDRSTVSGGIQNAAGAADSTISGGANNITSDVYATVGGGTRNRSSGTATTICGGTGNAASGGQATIGGGLSNRASGPYSAISGGYGNTADGKYSAVPGGSQNQAHGNYSLASGHQAQIDPHHAGVFLFADANNIPFPSHTSNEFAVRATGGVRFVSGIDGLGNPASGVLLHPGSGAWSMLSDREYKRDIRPVDPHQILTQLSQIPVTTWHYQGQDAMIRHIGPMAGDFHQIFGFGEDNHTISSVDADGVALAGVQGSYQLIQEQQSQMKDLEGRITRLEQSLATAKTMTWASLAFMAFSTLWLSIVAKGFRGKKVEEHNS